MSGRDSDYCRSGHFLGGEYGLCEDCERWQLSRMASATSAPRPRWEYQDISVSLGEERLQDALNKRGVDGWELVMLEIRDCYARAIFKRQAP